jgi:hypothetical protein
MLYMFGVDRKLECRVAAAAGASGDGKMKLQA